MFSQDVLEILSPNFLLDPRVTYGRTEHTHDTGFLTDSEIQGRPVVAWWQKMRHREVGIRHQDKLVANVWCNLPLVAKNCH